MKESIIIQSDSNGASRAEEFVGCFCDEMHAGNYFATISVAVGKAVDNAIRHGNAFDKSKYVTIEVGTFAGGIYFAVTDQGCGFDYTRYGALCEQGEGQSIFMMKMLSDRMEYSNGGRSVRLEFFISGIDANESLSRGIVLSKFNQSFAVNV